MRATSGATQELPPMTCLKNLQVLIRVHNGRRKEMFDLWVPCDL